MWAFLHTKTGTAMTAVGSNPVFARASGINVDRIRLLSVIMSTWLAAVGILVYEQGFGFIQLYTAPNNMTLPGGRGNSDRRRVGQQGIDSQRDHWHHPLPGHRDHDADGPELPDPHGYE